MRRIPLYIGALLLSFAPGAIDASQSRQLTFEDRVRAQEVIERVYYSHQIGATRSFEEAVPRGEAFSYLVEYFDGAFSGYEEATGGRQVAIISGDFCR